MTETVWLLISVGLVSIYIKDESQSTRNFYICTCTSPPPDGSELIPQVIPWLSSLRPIPQEDHCPRCVHSSSPSYEIQSNGWSSETL